jgi:hypothetical protein
VADVAYTLDMTNGNAAGIGFRARLPRIAGDWQVSFHPLVQGSTMGIFSTILSKLGFGGDTTAAATAALATAPAAESVPAEAAPTPIGAVDVVAKLEALASANPQKLNWKVSIVDLMKLLGLDSSLPARKELATELACPAEKMGDSAQMNMWLHKTVLQKLAENGGNVPKELLD